MERVNTKKTALLGLFIALSVLGAMMKIPSPVGSVALDAFPALVAAVLMDKRSGAAVGGLGHMMSALIAGFPLGPLHMMIAIEMAVIVFLFGVIYQKGLQKIAGGFFIAANSFLASLPMLVLFGFSFYAALLPSLFVGAAFNGVIAVLFIPKLKGYFQERIIRLMR